MITCRSWSLLYIRSWVVTHTVHWALSLCMLTLSPILARQVFIKSGIIAGLCISMLHHMSNTAHTAITTCWSVVTGTHIHTHTITVHWSLWRFITMETLLLLCSSSCADCHTLASSLWHGGACWWKEQQRRGQSWLEEPLKAELLKHSKKLITI